MQEHMVNNTLIYPPHHPNTTPWQDGRHFPEDIFRCIFVNEKFF